MNILSLRYFLKVAEYGTITSAASELHIAQPALTRHVHQLEHELGVKLLMRHGRGVRLTDPGRLLQARATEILAELDRLSDELLASQTEPQGTLGVGLPYAWSEHITAPVVKQFNDQYPEVQLTVIADSSETLQAMLKAQYLDFAVLTTNEQDPEVEARPIARDRMYLFGPKGSGLADLGEMSLSELAQRPTIRQHNATVASKRIDQALAHFGQSQNVLVSTSSSMMLELADLGLGFVAMAGCALGSRRYDLEAVLIADHSVTWTAAKLRTRPATAAIEAFRAILGQAMRARAAGGEWPGVELIKGAI
jgi:LysR family transcriptional regulator, nitrogen assimilation regulatory protein